MNKEYVFTHLITEHNRNYALLKYEIKQSEAMLHNLILQDHNQAYFSEHICSLCNQLAKKYFDYLRLFGECPNESSHLNLDKHNKEELCTIINTLQENLIHADEMERRKKIILELRDVYLHIGSKLNQATISSSVSELSQHISIQDELKKILLNHNIHSWLEGVIALLNLNERSSVDLSFIKDWSLEEKQSACNYFSKPDCVAVVNAIFFYKLYPDRLFNQLIHPEKLVSIRLRLGILYHFIEKIQIQLSSSLEQQGVKPSVDYLFHGDELPQGIILDVQEDYRSLIQTMIKKLNVHYSAASEEEVALERLYDLVRAYKFWFNPNRLIDAVMVLKQLIVKNKSSNEEQLSHFRQGMIVLYKQLNTTECLDLYGYFANNDSRYLIYTLFTLIEGCSYDWIPKIGLHEKEAIDSVYKALNCVMEALREELKVRHVHTEAYHYDLGKEYVRTGKRNQEAVFRIIAIYASQEVLISENIEKLFTSFEEQA